MGKQNIFDNPEFFKGYIQLRETGNSYNEVLEQPAIHSLLPASLEGLEILDLGCGAGHFAKYCVNKGANRVEGVDLSENMLRLANRLNSHPQIVYKQIAVEDVHFTEDSFDLVVSSLVFHYIQDYKSLLKKVHSWLKPGGSLVFSCEHPVATARKEQGWIMDGKANKLYWPVDDYGDETERQFHWFVDGVKKYHRKVSTLINELLDTGFRIRRVLEPEPTLETLERRVDLVEAIRRPTFIVIRAAKD
ncbi:hypothetical protein SY88_08190 [Clostridiales bacterium PH28_bin88]|nr:hypothetical protein SY88_08190 [Clostridiales bacterium PH28_bin88]